MIIDNSSRPRSIAVVLADDHDLLRMALRLILMRSGMWILAEASTPVAAVELARHPRAEVVILDLSWRTLDGAPRREAGLAALMSIRMERPRLPVLIYSTDGSEESVESCRRLGANGYMIKGVDDSRLVAAVRSVYEGERVWPPARGAKDALPGGSRTLVVSTSHHGGSPDSNGARRAPA